MKRNDLNMRDIDLAAYLDGRMTGAAREEFEQWLRENAAARDTAALARRMFDDRDDDGDAPERLMNEAVGRYRKTPDIFDLVVSLAGRAIEIISVSPGTHITTPATAGMVRGRDATAEPLYVAFRSYKLARVYVHVENMGKSLCQFTVQARDPLRDIPLENARVDLVSNWRELASNPLEAGTTNFEDVVPGQYELIVRKHDSIIGKMTIQIAGA